MTIFFYFAATQAQSNVGWAAGGGPGLGPGPAPSSSNSSSRADGGGGGAGGGPAPASSTQGHCKYPTLLFWLILTASPTVQCGAHLLF